MLVFAAALPLLVFTVPAAADDHDREDARIVGPDSRVEGYVERRPGDRFVVKDRSGRIARYGEERHGRLIIRDRRGRARAYVEEAFRTPSRQVEAGHDPLRD